VVVRAGVQQDRRRGDEIFPVPFVLRIRVLQMIDLEFPVETLPLDRMLAWDLQFEARQIPLMEGVGDVDGGFLTPALEKSLQAKGSDLEINVVQVTVTFSVVNEYMVVSLASIVLHQIHWRLLVYFVAALVLSHFHEWEFLPEVVL